MLVINWYVPKSNLLLTPVPVYIQSQRLRNSTHLLPRLGFYQMVDVGIECEYRKIQESFNLFLMENLAYYSNEIVRDL
jgi:hypothetical protein